MREVGMKTRAAVLRDVGKDWEIIELELDPPKDGEVLIRFVAAGLCHSDDHLRTGDIPVRYPIVGGHEGAGIVEEVGAGVSRRKPGDHVVCSFLPTCGHCRFCARGETNLCDLGALFIDNCLPDGTFRFHADGEDFGQMCLLGTFSQRSVVSEHSCVKIDDDLPLETVALVGCGVPTGWGTAVNAGAVRPGDTTVIYGIGGVGITGLAGPGKKTIQIPSFELTLFEKRIQGALFGSGNPFDTIPRLLELYQAGQLKLDELVTNRYTLDEVNQGYRDMLDGRNIRGLLIHES